MLNLRGQAYRVYDGAGVQTAVAYDFKGGLLAAERQLAVDVTATLDWSALGELEDVTDLENAAATMLEAEVFQTSGTFDALGRPRTQTTPDGTVVRLAYNEAALLESVSANVRGSASETAFVSNVDYDAQGRRSLIAYGNGTETTYAYDDVTQRLTRMRTSDSTRTFQDLTYTYDVVGNIVEIGDGAQDDVYFGGAVVTARQRYEYDALYRLTDAEGREHIGQNAAQPSEFGANASAHPQDGTAMREYAEAYVYDVVGNILSMQHAAAGGNWTRRYQYAGDGNRLQATSLPGDAAGQHSATYGYDAHGNMSSMPHLSAVRWNYADQMRSADLGGGGTVYFVYDGAGQRVRKVSVNQAGTQRTERIYLGAYELYRERTNGVVQLERETLHIADDAGRMCDVETRTVESGTPVASPTTHHRYQYSNHLGSASLELTGSAEVISYEEYHPYGTSSYRAVNSSIDVSERTYRYTGKERDEETGLGYHGARYYACWLGRWTASDPIGLGDGVNRYAYVSGRPISLSDPSGYAGEPFSAPYQTPEGAVEEGSGPPLPEDAGVFGVPNPDGTYTFFETEEELDSSLAAAERNKAFVQKKHEQANRAADLAKNRQLLGIRQRQLVRAERPIRALRGEAGTNFIYEALPISLVRDGREAGVDAVDAYALGADALGDELFEEARLAGEFVVLEAALAYRGGGQGALGASAGTTAVRGAAAAKRIAAMRKAIQELKAAGVSTRQARREKIVGGLAAKQGAKLIGISDELTNNFIKELSELTQDGVPLVDEIQAFGSRAGSRHRGRGPGPESDLDLLIVLSPAARADKQVKLLGGFKIEEALSKFEKAAKVPVESSFPRSAEAFKKASGFPDDAVFETLFRRSSQ